MAPNLSLQGPKCDPKWLQNGALGLQNEAQTTPKWSLGVPKIACGKQHQTKMPKSRFTQKLGVPFWSLF